MKSKKIIAGLVILAALSAAFFAGPKSKKTEKKAEKLRIVTTIFPEYDWTREILGDKISGAELTLLLGSGIDLHSYQPSIQDIAKISMADIFIYVGGESDAWVKNALKNAKNKDMTVINLMEVLGDKAKQEEIKEGMQAEEDEHHAEEEDGDEEPEYDEHVWLSLRNAGLLCARITDALCKKDSANAPAYRKNLEAYSARLTALDTQYSSAVKNGSKDTLLFADRFPFRYLTDDYNLDYYAAFVGCSAETEASFETIVFLAGKINELELNNVCKLESGDGKIARTVIQSSRNKTARILTLDSMQSVTAKQADSGTTYLGIMEKNLEVLKQALE